MQRNKLFFMMIATGFLLVFGTGLWLATAQPASAQCGSQASSCKNCHEVQAQKSVNTDGTGWHQSHAFGDFCYICHGGNQQATEKDASHAGMVSPLSDVKAACQSCHVKDFNERAKIYADKLGIPVGSGAAPAAGSGTPAPTKSAPAAAAGSTPAAAQPASGSGPVVVENQPVTDYVEQYNESVLGKTVVNWGNIIVAVMIVIMVIVGGTVIFLNERKLRGVPLTKSAAAAEGQVESIRLEDFPEDVVALLPRLKALNPVGRKALGKLLKDPEAASDLLLTITRLDPGLIKQMKGLDREAQALLIALAGDAF